jgi:hypothetical protein
MKCRSETPPLDLCDLASRKDLANILDITEHSNELAHEDFRIGRATSCPIQSTSGGSSWVARRDFNPELE